jgi:hypothetical protein
MSATAKMQSSFFIRSTQPNHKNLNLSDKKSKLTML